MTSATGQKNALKNKKSFKGKRPTKNKRLLELNSMASQMRTMPQKAILKNFYAAYYEDKILALKWLFYARDCRGGLGERRLFRICLSSLAKKEPEAITSLIRFVPEYGRWDDLFCLINTPLEDDMIDLLYHQLSADVLNMSKQKSVSLLAKWLPTETAHSEYAKQLSKKIYTKFGLNPRSYRKVLSSLRAYLKVVERYMSLNKWQSINYSAVPAKANIVYSNAFMRHDKKRRTVCLNNLKGKQQQSQSKNKHHIIHSLNSDRYKPISFIAA